MQITHPGHVCVVQDRQVVSLRKQLHGQSGANDKVSQVDRLLVRSQPCYVKSTVLQSPMLVAMDKLQLLGVQPVQPRDMVACTGTRAKLSN